MRIFEDSASNPNEGLPLGSFLSSNGIADRNPIPFIPIAAYDTAMK
jgi:hypothetical protein